MLSGQQLRLADLLILVRRSIVAPLAAYQGIPRRTWHGAAHTVATNLLNRARQSLGHKPGADGIQSISRGL
jgi:hypothetical protein